MSNVTIAVLFHRDMHPLLARRYTIAHMARFWKDDGNRVIFLYGTDRFVPADVCVVHVDLSVVPSEYLKFASQYPATVNGRVRDIRKSAISRNLVRPGDSYPGPVMIKTDTNYAGWPEKITQRNLAQLVLTKVGRRIGWREPGMVSPSDYIVCESVELVPERFRQDPRLVLEKFVPQLEGDTYFTNQYVFFGSSYHCFRLGCPNPVVNSESNTIMELIEPHPEIVARREEMGFDYGKFDYTIHNGKPHLLDANKLIGMSGWKYTDDINQMVRARGAGVYDFVPSRTGSG